MATILSAQCTDERVNMVTKELFRKYRAAADYARAPMADLEKAIQSTGFFRNKAKSIQNCCRILAEQYDGRCRRTSSNWSNCRASAGRRPMWCWARRSALRRAWWSIRTSPGSAAAWGFTKNKDAVKIETDLMALIPSKEWIAFSHRMIQHGRKICMARKPKCDAVRLSAVCPKIGVE